MKQIDYDEVYNFLIEQRDEYETDGYSWKAIQYLIEQFLHEF